MNIVFTALTVLSGITGFSSGRFYETKQEHFQDCLFEHFGSCSSLAADNSILSVEDLYDLDGSNRYLLISTVDDKTIVYDKKDEHILTTLDTNPYDGFKTEFKLLSNIEDNYMFAYYNEEAEDFSFTNNIYFDKEGIHTYFANQGYKAGNYYTGIAYTSDTVVIPNAFYFEKLGHMHATNSQGTCTVVAAEILLSYYDTFVNDYIIDEQYDQPAVENLASSTPTIYDFSCSPGADTSSCSVFHDYLCKIAIDEVKDDPASDGMNTGNQKKMMTKYLDKRDIKYKTHASEGNMSDIITNKAKGVIKNAIDSGRPVITGGEGHSTVAFAYNSDMVWVHTGWGYTAATPWRTFESGTFYNYSAGAIDFVEISKDVYVSSDNYYAPNKNLYFSPDGATYSETVLYPSNHGLNSTYYSYENKSRFYSNGVEIRNYYTRTILQSNEIILSAKRDGEGEACLQYWMTRRIRKLEIDMAFYSSSDVLAKENSRMELWVVIRGGDGNFYWVYTDNLIQRNLSSNRFSPTKLKYNFANDEAYGFRILVIAPAVGNANSGRVCVSYVNIQNSTVDHGLFGAF